jgi:hypothetical protein
MRWKHRTPCTRSSSVLNTVPHMLQALHSPSGVSRGPPVLGPAVSGFSGVEPSAQATCSHGGTREHVRMAGGILDAININTRCHQPGPRCPFLSCQPTAHRKQNCQKCGTGGTGTGGKVTAGTEDSTGVKQCSTGAPSLPKKATS